jgi:hypothetical protein
LQLYEYSILEPWLQENQQENPLLPRRVCKDFLFLGNAETTAPTPLPLFTHLSEFKRIFPFFNPPARIFSKSGIDGIPKKVMHRDQLVPKPALPSCMAGMERCRYLSTD